MSKYSSQLPIFLFFEKFFFINLVYKKNFFNIHLVFLPNNIFFKILKKMVYLSKMSMVDSTSTEFLPKIMVKKKFVLYVLHNYMLRKHNFFLFLKTSYTSIYSYHLSVNWLERELSEFYTIKMLGMVDTRNLFLDYNKTYKPLEKKFPVTGIEELFYNTLTQDLIFLKTNSIEL